MAGIQAPGKTTIEATPSIQSLMRAPAALGGPTTNAQNQWDWWNRGGWKTNQGGGLGAISKVDVGPRPIDEGAVAWERQLENDAVMRQRNAQQAQVQANVDANANDRAQLAGQNEKNFNYGLSTKAADDNQRRLFDTMDRLGMSSFFSGSGAGAIPGVSGNDTSWEAANAAAMGRAKDQAAAAVSAARKALLDNMTARGIGGSGIEMKNDRAIQLAGAGQIGEAGRTIATNTANRAAQVADRNYQGQIAQRGQDVSLATSKMGLLPSLMGMLRVSASY